MRVIASLPQADLNAVAEAARTAEAAGYDGVMTSEQAHDPFLPLAVAATATARVELATGVAIAFARSPMSAAHQGWDLHTASRGRFVMGLGSQIKAHNERRFSVPWSAPAPRMREYVGALRAIWRCWETGEPLDYRGEHYRFTLMTPNFAPAPSGLAPPPITIAAVGPAMLRLAGEACDGVRLHAFCTRRYLEEVVVRRLEEGLANGGRARSHFEICGGGFIATGADEATVAARFEEVRGRVAFYGSTPAYRQVFELHGLADLGPKLRELSRRGAWAAMAAEIPDEVVHLFAAVGTHAVIAGEIEARFGGVADTVTLGIAEEAWPDLPSEVMRDIQRIPSRFSGIAGAPRRGPLESAAAP